MKRQVKQTLRRRRESAVVVPEVELKEVYVELRTKEEDTRR